MYVLSLYLGTITIILCTVSFSNFMDEVKHESKKMKAEREKQTH